MKTVRRKPRGFESLSLRQLRPLTTLALATALLVATACARGGPQHFGTITGAPAPTPIPDLIASPELHLGQQIAVQGNVAQVCQEMGCWFEVEESGKRLMIDLQMGRHFTIPKNAAGLHARVEGKLIRDEGVLKIIADGVELSPTRSG